MKTTKRLLALVLCVVMVFGMIPVQAKAASDAVMVEHNGETTYYADLQKAFDGFAPSNNTYGGTYVVTLLADTTGVSKNLQYPTEVLNITLDLNGHTITGNGTSRAVNINLGSNATGITSATFTLKDSSVITPVRSPVVQAVCMCTVRISFSTLRAVPSPATMALPKAAASLLAIKCTSE